VNETRDADIFIQIKRRRRRRWMREREKVDGEYAKIGDWRRTANGDRKRKKIEKERKKLKIPVIKNFRNTSSPHVPVTSALAYIFFEDID